VRRARPRHGLRRRKRAGRRDHCRHRPVPPAAGPGREALTLAAEPMRSALSQQLIVGVTSHRNLAPGEIEPLRARVRGFLAQLQPAFPQLPLTVVSALAAGGDQLVAEEALALGARLVAPLPLPFAEYTRAFDDPAQRARFDALCRHATVVEAPVR